MKNNPQETIEKDLQAQAQEQEEQKQPTEAELILNAQAGDRNAINVMLKQYKNLVRYKAKAYYLAGAEHDDVIQEGMIGLCKAIRDFRPDRETPFYAFAEMCINRQIITAVKKATRQKHRPLNNYISLNRQVFGEEIYRTLEQTIPGGWGGNPETLLIDQENLAELATRLQGLMSGLEREVMHAYLEGKGYQEIAAEMGKSPKVIDNALQRAKRKVAACLKTRI